MSEPTDGPVTDYDNEWFLQRGIDDERVIAALDAVPRKPFVSLRNDGGDGEAHSTRPLPPIEVVGKLLTALDLDGDATVLEVGTDTGYLTALLAELAGDVYSVERRLQIAKLAEGRLDELDVDNVEVLYGPRLGEYALEAPYDGILLSAVAPHVPEKLRGRLAVGGRLVVPVAEGDDNPEVIAIERTGDETFERKSLGQLRFSSRLGEILVELGVADRQDIEIPALEADATGQRIGEALLEHSEIQERELVRALAIQRGHKIAPVDKLIERADHELAFSVPRAFLDHHRIIPLIVEGDELAVAAVDPDAPAIELAQMLEAESVESYLVTGPEFQRLWNTLLEGRGRRHHHQESIKERVEAKFETIVRTASNLQARTIHVDNEADGGTVRFRIDDELRSVSEIAFKPVEVDYLVEFLKLGADLDVLEQRVPQRGRFSWVRQSVTYHLNVHVMPSAMGEQLSVRLLSHGVEAPTLDSLGFPDDFVDDLDVLIQRLEGMFLVVGPRHTSKRDTFYALMARLADDGTKKVGTIEQDVRRPIPGVQQVMTCPERDFDYGEAIREFVRFHVDILGIDEIQNAEIAMEALSAARRGPRILATLHGRDADHVIDGLRDLGVPADALANGISGVLTQRIAPRICPKCRVPVDVDDKRLESLFGDDPPADFRAFRGQGCGGCDGTGTDGQIPVVSLLPFGNTLRQAVLSGESGDTIRKLARHAGVETIFDYATRLVIDGKISIDALQNFAADDR